MNKATGQATEPPNEHPGEINLADEAHEWCEEEAEPIGAVVGGNVKRLRELHVLTQHELAQRWQRHGLMWGRSKIAALEGGKRPRIDLGELPLMALGLGVSLSELLAGEGVVRLDPAHARMQRGQLRRFLADVDRSPRVWVDVDSMLRARAGYTAMIAGHEELITADVELARRLDLPIDVVIRAAMDLFDGLPLTAERDRRITQLAISGSIAERQAHRGHVTRELSAIVETQLDRTHPVQDRTPLWPRAQGPAVHDDEGQD